MKISTVKNFFKVGLSSLNLFPTKLLRLLIAVIFFYFIGYKYFYEKNLLGFGEDTNKSLTIEEVINPKDGRIIKLKKQTEQFQSSKTLWDWLGLAGTLAIPLVLYLFQASEQRRAEERAEIEKKQAEDLAEVEKYIAEDNLREQALEAYTDRMAEIFINPLSRNELFLNKDINKDNSVRDVARVRTVTILRRLENDIKRQNRILHFLDDSELLKFLLKNANFSSINMKGFNFSGINLSDAVFRDANLMGAKFNYCKLYNANFSNANLNGVDFTNAELFGAIFTGANLNGANLENIYIVNIQFTNADLTNANLISCKTWDDEELDNNYEIVYDEGDEYALSSSYQKWYKTDFSGVKLVNANLYACDLRSAKNIEIDELKKATNWDDAIYKDELFNELGLPEKFMSVIENIFKNVESDDDIDLNIFIGSQVEIRNKIDYETKIKTTIKGEITGFTKRTITSFFESDRYNKNLLTIKTSDGMVLDKIEPYNVYVYMDTLKS